MQYFDNSLAHQTFAATGSSLRQEVDAAGPRLRALSNARAASSLPNAKWSPEQVLGHVRFTIADGPAITLRHVALDYVGHVQHHLRQIFHQP